MSCPSPYPRAQYSSKARLAMSLALGLSSFVCALFVDRAISLPPTAIFLAAAYAREGCQYKRKVEMALSSVTGSFRLLGGEEGPKSLYFHGALSPRVDGRFPPRS